MKKAMVLPIPVDTPARKVSSIANDRLISMIPLGGGAYLLPRTNLPGLHFFIDSVRLTSHLLINNIPDYQDREAKDKKIYP